MNPEVVGDGMFGFNERSLIAACKTIRLAPVLYPFKDYPAIYLPATFSDGLANAICRDFLARQPVEFPLAPKTW
jgi:hypothetical protein